MRYPKKSIIPEKLQREYEGELSSIFHTRVNLFCYIAVIFFIIQMALGLTAFPGMLSPKDIPGIIVGLSLALALLLAEKRPKSLARHKLRALFLSLAMISIAICSACAHPEMMSHLGITLVLMAYFLSVLLMPWRWFEAIAIGVFALIAFIWVYTVSNVFASQELLSINVILLYISIFICAVVEQSEEILHQRAFVARKEIEEKNAVMAKELELANKIHKSLLPHSMRHELVDIAVTYKPMLYMGGDYAKFQFIDKDKLLFIIADVTGHGVSSALLVNRVHTEVERLMKKDMLPGKLLKTLDAFIHRDFGHIGFFLTAFCGLLDFSKGKLLYTNYGHPPQIFLQSKDNEVIMMKSQTFLMGIGMKAHDVYTNEVPFTHGDRLILFTDGVVEAKNLNNELFGHQRLAEFTKSKTGLDVVAFNNKLVDEIHIFQSALQTDDIFLLTIQTK